MQMEFFFMMGLITLWQLIGGATVRRLLRRQRELHCLQSWVVRRCSVIGILLMMIDPNAQAADDVKPNYICASLASVYVGGIKGAEALASPIDVPLLKATRNVSFYLTSYALTQVKDLHLSDVVHNWSGRQPGIIEVGSDPVNMRDITKRYGSYVSRTNSWTWGMTKGRDWPVLIAAAAWKPTIAMLNVFTMDKTATDPSKDPYFQMNVMAMADVRAAAGSIKTVLPYLTPNGEVISPSAGNSNWSSPYWNTSRALALRAGGFGMDTPANYFLRVREPAYRSLVVQQIQWGVSHGLIVEVLLSIYDTDSNGGVPQFQYDNRFAEAVKEEVEFLHEHGADPTVYAVVNYSEGPSSNLPGPDSKAESVGAAALWVARHTSPSKGNSNGSVTPSSGCIIR